MSKFNLVMQLEGQRTCGQCCVAMILGITRDEAIKLVGKKGGTNANDLRVALFEKGVQMVMTPTVYLGPSNNPPLQPCIVRVRYDTKRMENPRRKRWTHWMLWTGTEMICPDRGRLPNCGWYKWTEMNAYERVTSVYPFFNISPSSVPHSAELLDHVVKTIWGPDINWHTGQPHKQESTR